LKKVVLTILFILVIPATMMAQDLMDKGVFAIYKDGKPLGSETFTVSLLGGKGSVVSDTSYNFMNNGNPVEVKLHSELQLGVSGAPISYKLKSTSGLKQQSLSVEFKPRLALCKFDLGSDNKTMAVILPSNIIIRDENIFSHWEMLLAHYSMKQKGTQTFTVFVPRMGDQGVGRITMSLLGKERVSVGASRTKAFHFNIKSPQLSLEVWIDKDGRILKISVPANKTEIVRAQ